MKEYIGLKKIKAKPMTKADAQLLTGYTNDTCDREPTCHGYLVEYEGGYQSWSPKDVFEEAYKEIKEETFIPVMKFFSYKHLPLSLQNVSAPICMVAQMMDSMLKDGPEKSAGLRKLLEAKDCFVRAYIEK